MYPFLIVALWGGYYHHSHFIDNEIEVQRG